MKSLQKTFFKMKKKLPKRVIGDVNRTPFGKYAGQNHKSNFLMWGNILYIIKKNQLKRFF